MAEGISAGTAYIDIVPQMSKFASGVSSKLKGSLGKVRSLGNSIGAQLGVGISAAAAVELGKSSFEAFEGLEKSTKRWEFALKAIKKPKALDDLLSWSQDFSRSTGINQQAIVDMGSKLTIYGRQFFGSVGSKQASADITKLTGAFVNLGAATGKSGALLLRSLGPEILNDPKAASAQLLKYGALTDKQVDKVNKLVAAGKTQAATQLEINNVSKKFSGIAAAQATPLDKLKNLFNQLQLFIGQYVEKGVDAAINAGYAFVKWFHSASPVAEQFRKTLVKLRDAFDQAFQYIQKHPQFFKDLAIGIAAVAAATLVLTAAMVVLEAVASPVVLIVLALGALVAAFIYAYQNSQTFRTIVANAWTDLQKLIAAAVKAIKAEIADVSAWIKSHMNDIRTAIYVVQQVVKNLVAQFKADWPEIRNALKAAVSIAIGELKLLKDQIVTVGNVIGDLARLVSDIAHGRWSDAWNQVKNVVHDALGGIKKMVGDVASGLGGAFADIIKIPVDAVIGKINGIKLSWGGFHGHGGFSFQPFDIPMLAKGGRTTKGMPYIVGDGGEPELFVPDSNGTVIPRSKLAGVSSSGAGGGMMQAVIVLDDGTKLSGYVRTLARDEDDKGATHNADRGKMRR